MAYKESEYDRWDEPLPDFDLAPVDGNPPAVIAVAYSNPDIAGRNEADLNLYHLTDYSQVLANRACGLDYDGMQYEVARFPQDSLLAVPIYKASVIVLSDEQPSFTLGIYLPLLNRH